MQQHEFDSQVQKLSPGAKQAYDNVVDRYGPQRALQYAQGYLSIEGPIARPANESVQSVTALTEADLVAPDIMPSIALPEINIAPDVAALNVAPDVLALNTNQSGSSSPFYLDPKSANPDSGTPAGDASGRGGSKAQSWLEPSDYAGEILGAIGDGLERFAEQHTPKLSDLEMLFESDSNAGKLLSGAGKKALAVPGVAIDSIQAVDKYQQDDYHGAIVESGGLIGGLSFGAGSIMAATAAFGPPGWAVTGILAVSFGLIGTSLGKQAGNNIANELELKPLP